MTKRITTAHFDPHVMLSKALAGAYPSARDPRHRDAEIAYWRRRVAEALASADAEAKDRSEP